MNIFFKRVLTALLAAGVSCTLFAQQKGNLSGVITDTGGNVLPGAFVVLDGTTLGTSSDLNGRYLLQGVPAGDAKFNINYLGYKTVSFSVKITAGKTATKDVVLEEETNAIDGVVVSAVVDGQQRALNQQKNANNFMQIVSSDQMGRFPDLNVAEALQRVSGVTITRSRGEGNMVQLRGTPANFTNINVNGEQIMGTDESGSRSESLDLVPADVLASMEVQKTLLPSNDGDAIAGVINMRTSTARSVKPRVTVDLSSGYNLLREKAPYNIKAGYSQRFAANRDNPNGRFGIAANVSYYTSFNGYDRLEAQTWKDKKVKDASGETSKKYVPLDFRYRYQEGTRTRLGTTLTLDWTPNADTKFVLSAMYNKRGDDDVRYRNRTRLDKAKNFIEGEDGSLNVDVAQKILQVTKQDIYTDNFNITFEGETVLGDWKLDGSVFYSRSHRIANSYQYGFQTPRWQAGKAATLGNGTALGKLPKGSIAQIPDYQSRYLEFNPLAEIGGKRLDDLSYYEFYTLDLNNNILDGRNLTAKVNASYNYFIGENSSTLSFGAKGKFMHNSKRKSDDRGVFDSISVNPEDKTDLSLSNFLKDEQLSSGFLNGNLSTGFGAAPDAVKVHDFFVNSRDRFNENKYRTETGVLSSYYDAREDVVSAYAMNKIQFDKLMLIAGVRAENTRVSYKANSIFRYDKAVLDLPDNVNKDPHYNGGQLPGAIEDDTQTFNDYVNTPKDSTRSYLMVLPNIQIKYDFTPNTILRLAYTTGYSRPNVLDLVPTIDVNTDLGKVQMGNSGLKAAYAHNFDVLFEQYLKNVGLLSGGVFYKRINDFQYQSEAELTDPSNPYYNPSESYKLIQQKNGQAANLYGAEVTLNSNLSFLPGFLKYLVFTGNYTYTHSSAYVNEERGSLRFPGQASHTGNIALAYSTKRFTLQASANYNGEFIYALGSNDSEDLWMDSRWQLDANASVNIIKGLTLYAEAVNLLNAPTYIYYGNRSKVYELEYTSQVVRVGLSYKF